MKEQIIKEIEQQMSDFLNNEQKKKLSEILQYVFFNIEITKIDNRMMEETKDYEKLFLSSKRVEGCSERSLNYYKTTIDNMKEKINKKVNFIETDDIRKYLSDYQEESKCSKTTIDNIRRILSSYFSWLEDENYIVKNPIRRIHKIKTAKLVKETFTDEEVETMRDYCKENRDLALIDFLYSTGVRVGELVNVNIEDVNFEDRSCIVLGKGNKQREVYFDARTKIHLQEYINQRKDNNKALFVSLQKPYNRLNISRS